MIDEIPKDGTNKNPKDRLIKGRFC